MDYDHAISTSKTPRKRNRSVRSPTESDISAEHKRQNTVYYYSESKVLDSKSLSESGGETDKTIPKISNLFTPKQPPWLGLKQDITNARLNQKCYSLNETCVR